MLNSEIADRLKTFLTASEFPQRGAVFTDLDGTAVHEEGGRVYIPQAVELGLREIYGMGRPIVLNSLRFPLSVLRTFGAEWFRISNAAIPCVTLNGSLMGYLNQDDDGELGFAEISAAPLNAEEIDAVIDKISLLVQAKIDEILLFYYPRDWRLGEVIWTPLGSNIAATQSKYPSASLVTAVHLEKLRARLHAEDICMIFMLVDVPEDQRMAYQHTQRSNFITHEGVDKLSGAKTMADHLEINLEDSIGAGDTEMDRFLNAVGLAVIVGVRELTFAGRKDTLRLPDSSAFGDLLFSTSALLAQRA